MYFGVKFTEVSGFYSPQDSSKRQSGTQHSKELVLTSCQWTQSFSPQRSGWPLHHQEGPHHTATQGEIPALLVVTQSR